MARPFFFLLPHAGGNAGRYAALFPALAGKTHLTPLDLPGHGVRGREAPLTRLPDMVNSMLDSVRVALAGAPDAGCVLFGHSMGALISYLLALELVREGRPPRHLFLSSGFPPGRCGAPPGLDKLSDRDFWAACARRFGGISGEALASPELRDYFVPLLRADIGAILAYTPAPAPALAVPVSLLHGERDIVEAADLREWRGWCGGDFRQAGFPGDHFYLFASGPAVEAFVLERLFGRPPAEG
ncbi:MAG: alpha/beta fold hydrolase [Planctomycetota bacterium]|jgi:pyochelin biosynthetic protein PchC|nr:alpha/beta fold hydrolase [Planctomycetota bacterium]